MNSAGLDPVVLLPALAAGLLVLASHVPLGMAVLERGIVFLDLAIAQFAGLGVVLVNAYLDGAPATWQIQAGAVAAAALGALFLRTMEKRLPHRQEAVIGVAFVVAACAALVLMSHDPHGAEHLQDMLVGQILWSTWSGLVPLALVTALVLAAWFGLRLGRTALGFYLLFALTVTASVQVVGIYLVFASLIVPALAAGRRLWLGYLLGAVGYAGGLAASGLFDLPSGAAVVLALAATSGVVGLLRQRRPDVVN
ncbi:metal ABC transporter permease [Parasulfuritortus cantonensis]|uniref:Metal ABC transporter permease n=1 Tax=Parasulfuritortus cantonensis TaxID=2528202 RepID=A0A4R1BEK9_9PROT|nr:metal ABC transporter permease [Parasulfuritortus cantonensis]TCJ15504.1 metal ABC transporter permease [Parasulfuritortus cantonensis]